MMLLKRSTSSSTEPSSEDAVKESPVEDDSPVVGEVTADAEAAVSEEQT